ncbi:MAG TPA: DUF2723 domain-containing protein [Bacteroidia bacterium]|nr:DUF2723 domain-containing protein [Bacteroidia bacterium]
MNLPPQYRLLNIITGWIVFAIAAIVYLLTLEPTASFWDCGEYIACAWGLESGHPPGAPFFMILGRAFGLLSFGNNENVAWLVNCMSGLASAATVMFLFWTITHLAKKIILRYQQPFSQGRLVLVMLAGMCGSLTYAFTDSFWFSAVEGEVYALSSLFTAIVFWAMLRWEDQADDPRSDRWIVLIAALIGMSIGVHLLNLLAIPALVFIWYFRKTQRITWRGFLITFVTALVLLGGIQDILIPGIVKLAGKSELFFVNEMGMRFNSGIIAFFVLLAALIVFGLWWSIKNKIRWLNTSVLAFTVLLLGYSSFLVIVIRANAGTPINENNPSDPVSLLSYLNREQYGDWPLLYGPQFNSPQDAKEPWADGNPVYVKDEKSGRYIVSDSRKGTVLNYDSRGCVFFPRMYSSGHKSAYTNWVEIKGNEVDFANEDGKSAVVNIPTFSENMRFFTTYQVGWMYLRYFMWNFVGRQNDFAGYGGDAEGNWRSGISFLDDFRIGDHDIEPTLLKNNKARNGYWFLPLILGIIGIIYHFMWAKRDALVTTLLFLFTGLCVVVYLNQTPWQPRERDYAYVGSFYAFAIWIGLGVMVLYDLKKSVGRTLTLVAAVAVSGIVPTIVLVQNWDDHNRSHRTVARDLAVSMLESCEKNAILFTYADNDTFPLWYAQEVLGIRRDVRIVCLSLFRSDWYIDQAKKKQYTSEPMPISLDPWQYREGTRDWLSIDAGKDTMLLENVVTFFTQEDFQYKYETMSGDTVNYIPTRFVKIAADNDSGEVVWTIPGSYLLKDQIIILDILAHNEWKRPIHFAVNMPMSCYGGLGNYLQLEGLTYRFVPTFNHREDPDLTERPLVNLEKCYRLFTEKFSWGGLENPDVYADETTQRMFSDPYRYSCAVTAHALAEAGMNDEAADLVRICTERIPASQILPDDYWISLTDAAWMSGDNVLANKIANEAFTHFIQCVKWYDTLPRPSGDQGNKIGQIQLLYSLADLYGQTALTTQWKKEMDALKIPME